VLRGARSVGFAAAALEEMGLTIDGQVREMKFLRHASGERLVAVARNNAELMLLQPLRRRPAALAGAPN
jgi:hypothetical protein